MERFKIQNINAILKSVVLFIGLLLVCNQTIAQGEVNFKVGVFPDSVTLGKPFDLNVQLSLPIDGRCNAVTIYLDSLRTLARMLNAEDSSQVDYEVLNYGKWSAADKLEFLPRHLKWESNKTGQVQVFSNTLKIIIWEPGIYLLPGLKADVDVKQGGYEVFSNEVQIQIGFPDIDQIPDVDSLLGIAPIKSIEREGAKSYLTIIALGLLGLLLLGAIIYFLATRKKEEKVIYVPPVPAHEKALLALEEIRHRKDWETGLLKKYYDELTLVIRRYLEDRYEIKALESTTDEIINDLGKIKLDTSWKNELKRLLPMTDLVKFAKADPTHEEHTKWLEWAKSMVQSTKKIETPIEENINKE